MITYLNALSLRIADILTNLPEVSTEKLLLGLIVLFLVYFILQWINRSRHYPKTRYRR